MTPLWPSPDEYLTGARLAAANARRLSRSARRLERSGDFGPATALFATALEEAVKVGVLVLLKEENEAVSGDHDQILRLVFRDHKTKYRLAAWATGTSGKRDPEFPSSGAPKGLAAFVGVLLLLVWLMGVVQHGRRLAETRHDVELVAAPLLTGLADTLPDGIESWAAKAFTERNRGLYVGFVGGKWVHPGQMTQEDAAEARRGVVPIVQTAWAWASAGKALI